MNIRMETAQDWSQVEALVQEAFATAEHRDGNEQDLVRALRNSEAFVPELSLVAEEQGQLVGHILFTRAQIGGVTGLVLAPLAVLPTHQRQGVGSALVREGHRIARALGYPYCSVLGSETYYPRVGYVPATSLGIQVPDGIPPANFMAIRLREDAPPIQGPVVYAKEFGMEG